MNKALKSAWLITWDWAGEHAKKDDPIAVIVNHRLSNERVKEYVEQLYANSEYSYSERLRYANDKKFNPYPAKYDSIEGVPYTDRIVCGHNPLLYARRVRNLRVKINEDGEQELNWDEIPKTIPKSFEPRVGPDHASRNKT